MPELPRIVLLHGEQHGGKDTVGRYLVEQHGYVQMAFADKLREMCLALNPVVSLELSDTIVEQIRERGTTSLRKVNTGRLADVVEQLGWDEAKARYPEVRRTLQRLATEVVRDHVNADFWAHEVGTKAMGALIEGGRVVITDLRFPNEERELYRTAALCDPKSKWLTTRVWWIQRPKNPYRDRQGNNHVSEAWHPERFYPLVNDTEGNLAGLYAKVEDILAGKVRELYQPLPPVTESVQVLPGVARGAKRKRPGSPAGRFIPSRTTITRRVMRTLGSRAMTPCPSRSTTAGASFRCG